MGWTSYIMLFHSYKKQARALGCSSHESSGGQAVPFALPANSAAKWHEVNPYDTAQYPGGTSPTEDGWDRLWLAGGWVWVDFSGKNQTAGAQLLWLAPFRENSRVPMVVRKEEEQRKRKEQVSSALTEKETPPSSGKRVTAAGVRAYGSAFTYNADCAALYLSGGEGWDSYGGGGAAAVGVVFSWSSWQRSVKRRERGTWTSGVHV